MDDIKRSEIEKRIDILEDDIANINPILLELLLKDKTTNNNILWCTKDYEQYGLDYSEQAQMKVELITGRHSNIIQPRAAKSKAVQDIRIKKRAEVFTPSWICNEQNNLIDAVWFERENVFNKSIGTSWTTTKENITFPRKKDWKKYVNLKRLEITCGEAPYLVSRYDTTTGELIPIYERIGIFDRKMRIIEENCNENEDWVYWSIRAVESVYGYEFQGDSVLIARENLLYDYLDYYKNRFGEDAPISLLKKIANIISWNIWQMDGSKYVVPYSCHETIFEHYHLSLFEDDKVEEKVPCPGCESGNVLMHNGIYCRIFDWTNYRKSIPFVTVLQGGMRHGKI